METTTASAAAPAAPRRATAARAQQRHRRTRLSALAGVVVLAGIAYGIYWALVLSHYESTDNAYVQGNVVQLTPQVGGTVIAISADDTDFVKAGQALVKLDPADAQVALDQAEAQLAQAVRQVRTLYRQQRHADGADDAARGRHRARPERLGARPGRRRRGAQPLVGTGAVGKEEFNHVEIAARGRQERRWPRPQSQRAGGARAAQRRTSR